MKRLLISIVYLFILNYVWTHYGKDLDTSKFHSLPTEVKAEVDSFFNSEEITETLSQIPNLLANSHTILTETLEKVTDRTTP